MVDASIEIATEEDVTAHFDSNEDTVAALFTQHDEVEDIPDSLHIYSETREPIASKLEKMLRYGVNPAAVAQQLSLLSNKGEGRVENIETRLLPGSGALQCHGEKISKPHLAEHVDNSNYVECTICFETLSVNSLHAMTSVHLVRPCKFRCCANCANLFVVNKIEEGESTFKCPSLNCNRDLLPADIRHLLTLPTQSRSTLEEQQTIQGRLAMFEVCREVNERTLAERDARLLRRWPTATDIKNDLAFHIWSCSSNVRSCPGCKIAIEKNGGCLHMTCTRCRTEFFWCCGQRYRNSNHSKYLCMPFQLIFHDSIYWGPILPVRALTKSVVGVSAVGLGLAGVGVCIVVGVVGAAAGVLVAPYLLYSQCSERRLVKSAIQSASDLRASMEATNLEVEARLADRREVARMTAEATKMLRSTDIVQIERCSTAAGMKIVLE